MYQEDLDFYSLDDQEQRRLVYNKQVATTDQLLSEVPEGEPAVRVFEKSLDQQILDLLERRQYTMADLAEYFGVRSTDVQRILNKYRRRGMDDFTSEHFKQHLLLERNGILRAVGEEGPNVYYSLETIPFFARVMDPTLGFSLIDYEGRLADFPRVTEHIPGGKSTDLDEDYAFIIGEYWGIEPEDVFEFLVDFDREYIETSLLPLPRVTAPDEYARVGDRFKQVDLVYKMFRTEEDDVEGLYSDFLTRFDRGQVGLADYQIINIELADLTWYAQYKNHIDLLEALELWMEEVTATLHPERAAEDPDGDGSESINLRDEILLALSETPSSASKILESLPRDAQLQTDESEVATILERLSNTGVIDKQSGTPKYYLGENSKPWN